MTKTYKTLEHAYQALTDLEIQNDSKNFPVAIIGVSGMHNIKIKMVNSYDYYYALVPLQNKILNYYLNRFSESKNELDQKKLTTKINDIIQDISSIKTKEDVEKKSSTLSHLFDEEYIRKEFFKGLKKLHIIKWWVTWRKYQRCMRPIDTLTVFSFLWLFNFDGVKKNVKFLIEKIIADMNCQLPIISTNSGDWESYKAKLQEAHEKAPWLNNLRN